MDFVDYLDINFGFHEVEGGNQLKLIDHCPFCHESRSDLRVYVNRETGLGNCFHCGTGFNAVKFVMAAENCSAAKAKAILNDDGNNFIKGKLHQDEGEPQEALQIPSLSAIADIEEAAVYLKSRGITDEMIEHYKLFYCNSNVTIKNKLYYTISRIFIPVHDLNGVCAAWQARDITGKARVKYLSTPGWDSNEFLFNAWAIPNNPDYLIISEGVFDVFGWHRAGIKNCVATFGKKISSSQIEIIKKINPKIVFIAWDTDANWKKYEFMEAHKHRWTIRFIDLCGRDADELSREDLLASIMSSRLYNWSDKIVSAL